MKSVRIAFVASLLLLAACVTINIYFPAAEAREAAEKIVDDILGDEAKQAEPGSQDQSMDFKPASQGYALNLLNLLIPTAEAAVPNFDADTPAVRKLQAAMKQRHTQLKGFYRLGAIGFTQDALVGIRKLSAVPLKQRRQLKNLLSAENSDRNQLYKEIARANGHPEWEKDVRATFSKTWISNAAKGWWYQNSQGGWVQK
ncbi:MAG: YdbL family protein [Candidatus Thiodiazotropha sp. (ex Monitilora ramsayi)]|nr:YdbL family protein [Candidatus Thiodiazotropha sp. (ex Monitilora ramsayi)]